jgi:phage shock protein A
MPLAGSLTSSQNHELTGRCPTKEVLLGLFRRDRSKELIYQELDDLKAAIVKIQTELATTKKSVAEFELDYNMLYEKIRINLAKLAKRAKDADKSDSLGSEVDPVTLARRALVAKKFGGNSGV